MDTKKEYFSDEIKEIIETWKGKPLLYVHPTAKMLKKRDATSVAASKITCGKYQEESEFKESLKSNTDHFAVIDATLLQDHCRPTVVLDKFESCLCGPWIEYCKQHPLTYVTHCIADIMEHTLILKGGIRNEAGVRFAYANPIILMLCRSFGYCLTMEESDVSASDTLSTSSGSRYDYVCWRLMNKIPDGHAYVPLVVIETKRTSDLLLDTVGQAIGYYSRSKGSVSGTGVALILNEYKTTIQFRVVLFPYIENSNDSSNSESPTKFGVQALVLPIFETNHDDFLKGDLLKFICAICTVFLLGKASQCCFTVPSNLELIVPTELIGAYSEMELLKIQHQKEMEEQKKEMEEQMEEQKKKEMEEHKKEMEEYKKEMEEHKKEMEEHKKEMEEEIEKLKKYYEEKLANINEELTQLQNMPKRHKSANK